MFQPKGRAVLYSHIINSREPPWSERGLRMGEIICNDRQPDWGDNPALVISEACVPAGKWREIMIVDSIVELCSFRSTTGFKYEDY